MELIKTKKMSNPIFCSVCEKDRKHVLATYESVDENNDICEIQMQKCKSCGTETQI